MRLINSLLICLLISSCALPRPVAVERQDFVSKREVLLASLVKQAQTDYVRGRYLDAEGSLRKALYIAPDTTQIALNLGSALIKNGQIPEAQKIFDKILLRKPKDIALKTYVGEAFFESAEYQKAEYLFDRSLELIELAKFEQRVLEPALIEAAQRSKTVAAFYRSDIEAAICLAHETFITTQNPDNLVKLLRLEMAFGRFSQVEARVNGFLIANPATNDARIFLLRSLSRFGLGNIEKGKEDLVAAQKREESIGDFVLELLLLGESYIAPEIPQDEDEIAEQEELISLQELTASQRLFLPFSSLNMLDNKLAEKRIRYEELGLGE